ncbi:MAG: O-antigen ligase family protein [Chloroflexi bacterium]|nr:O-antigen ligase family protein [Chloroflexota bacterium]
MIRRAVAAFLRWEWICLLFLLPLTFLGMEWQTAVLFFILLFWLLRRLATGHFVPPTPLNVSLLLLLLMVLVSLYATFDIPFSFGKVVGVWYGVAIYFAWTDWAGGSARRLAWAVVVLLAAGLGVVGLSLLGTSWPRKLPLLGPVVSAVQARLPARLLTLGGPDGGFNPNQVAGVLLWVAPLALALLLALVWRWREARQTGGTMTAVLGLLFLAGSTAVLTGALLLTQSRGGLLGFAIGAALMAGLALRRYWRWLAGAALVVLFAVAVLAQTQNLPALTSALFAQAGVPTGQEAALADGINTLNGRIEIWSRGIYGVQDFPFTGMGMNNFRRVVHILYPLFLISPDTDIAHAHNHLLQAALDLGIPGLVAYLALWLGSGAMLWRAWRAVAGQPTAVWSRALVIGLAGSLAAHFVYGMLDAVALGAKPGFIFWLLLGLVAALHRQIANYQLPTTNYQLPTIN